MKKKTEKTEKTEKSTKSRKSDIKIIARNKDNIIVVNNTKIIGRPRKSNITFKILRTYFKELLLIGNINVSLDVSKIGRRKGNEILKRGKIAIENNILEDSYYRKFSVLSSRVQASWISKSIQRLQESNNKGGNNLQWLLEQQAPEDFRKIQENNDTNAMNLIFALQNTTAPAPGSLEENKKIAENQKKLKENN